MSWSYFNLTAPWHSVCLIYDRPIFQWAWWSQYTTFKKVIAFFFFNNTQWTETDRKAMEDLRFFSKPVSVFVNYLKWVFFIKRIGRAAISKSSLTAFPVNTSFWLLVAHRTSPVPLWGVELRVDKELIRVCVCVCVKFSWFHRRVLKVI